MNDEIKSLFLFVVVVEEHRVMTAPPPHAGVALITVLNILEGYNITSQVPRNSSYHQIAEVRQLHRCTTESPHSVRFIQHYFNNVYFHKNQHETFCARGLVNNDPRPSADL